MSEAERRLVELLARVAYDRIRRSPPVAETSEAQVCIAAPAPA
jgi:hypothetical protein